MCHPVGGIRSYIRYNYPMLQKAGYRFTFLAPDIAAFAEFQTEFKSWEGTEFVKAPSQGDKNRLWPTVRRLLRQGRFALIHSQGLTAGVHCAAANLRLRAPHILTLHDVIRENQFTGVKAAPSLWIIGSLLNRIEFIVAPSDDARENHLRYMPRLGRGRCRMVTIPHGIPLRHFDVSDTIGNPPLRTRLSLGRDVYLLGFLGRFMEQKGFLFLVEALERLLADKPPPRPVHLLAVGSGDCLVNYRWELDRFPRAAGCITFLEQVPNVAPILQELDLLVMPSLWESFGLLAGEAMCMGIPVLGTNCIGLREVLRDTPSVTVPVADARALASAIDRAIRSPWTDAARQFVPEARKRFDVGPRTERLVELFDELTA
jgi:glycosyltransferase involved in cell wall biosynthesis